MNVDRRDLRPVVPTHDQVLAAAKDQRENDVPTWTAVGPNEDHLIARTSIADLETVGRGGPKVRLVSGLVRNEATATTAERRRLTEMMFPSSSRKC